jgi:hypothetical protein
MASRFMRHAPIIASALSLSLTCVAHAALQALTLTSAVSFALPIPGSDAPVISLPAFNNIRGTLRSADVSLVLQPSLVGPYQNFYPVGAGALIADVNASFNIDLTALNAGVRTQNWHLPLTCYEPVSGPVCVPFSMFLDLPLSQFTDTAVGAPYSYPAGQVAPSARVTGSTTSTPASGAFSGHLRFTGRASVTYRYEARYCDAVRGANTTPTLQLAQLSQLVYDSGNLTSPPPPFTLLKAQGGSDFVMAAFRNGNDIVVSVRGTEPALLASTHGRANVSFVTGVPTDALRELVAMTSNFVFGLQQQHPGASIALTGHSLGGGVAQILGAVSGLPTTTFNAPGTGALVPQLETELFPVSTPGAVADISNVRIYGDQVSLVGRQVGPVTTLPSTLPQAVVDHKTWESFGENHSISSVVRVIDACPPPSFSSGPVAPVLVAPAAINGATSVYRSAVQALAELFLDPIPAAQYEFVSDPGSPSFASLSVPAIPGVMGFEIQEKRLGVWTAVGTVAPVERFEFGAPVREFRLVASVGRPNFDASAQNIVFGVTFATAGEFSGSIRAAPFADVTLDASASEHVYAIFQHRPAVTLGCSSAPLLFCPAQPVTRAQMAAFLVRALEGEPGPDACGTGSDFNDVPAQSPSCKYVKRLAALGITNGCGAMVFCPAAEVTREQMAAFLIRALEGEPDSQTCSAGSGFVDVDAQSPSCKYIKRLALRGVTLGCAAGHFCPSRPVLRDQMAVFLARAFFGLP